MKTQKYNYQKVFSIAFSNLPENYKETTFLAEGFCSQR